MTLPLSTLILPPRSLPAGIDPTKTKQVQLLKQPSPLLSCRIDPFGRYVVAGSQDNVVQRWNLATGERTPLAGHISWVRGLAFASQLGLLCTGGYDGRLMAWLLDAPNPWPVREVQAHTGWIRSLAVSGDGKMVASCGNDRRVCVWSATDGHLMWELRGHPSHVYNVAFHPHQPQLASADLMGVVKRWDLTTGKSMGDLDGSVLHKYDKGFRADIGGARSMTYSPDGQFLACGGITEVSNAFAGVGKPAVVLFDCATGKRKHLLVPKANFQGTMWGVVFHPQGNLVIGLASGSGASLFFWKLDQAQSFHALALPVIARDLDIHPDGRRLALAGFDGSTRIYDMGSKAKG